MKFKIKEKVTTFRKVATLVENAVKSNQRFAALQGGCYCVIRGFNRHMCTTKSTHKSRNTCNSGKFGA